MDLNETPKTYEQLLEEDISRAKASASEKRKSQIIPPNADLSYYDTTMMAAVRQYADLEGLKAGEIAAAEAKQSPTTRLVAALKTLRKPEAAAYNLKIDDSITRLSQWEDELREKVRTTKAEEAANRNMDVAGLVDLAFVGVGTEENDFISLGINDADRLMHLICEDVDEIPLSDLMKTKRWTEDHKTNTTGGVTQPFKYSSGSEISIYAPLRQSVNDPQVRFKLVANHQGITKIVGAPKIPTAAPA